MHNFFPNLAGFMSFTIFETQIWILYVLLTSFFFSEPKTEEPVPEHKKYYERTFISILNDPQDVTFKNLFQVNKPPKPAKGQRCVITKYLLFFIYRFVFRM